MVDEEYEEDNEDDEDGEDSKYEDGDITESGKPYLKLVGRDGNAFSILGFARRAARKAGWPAEKVAEYSEKAMSGDYNHLLGITMEYFEVE